MPVVEAGPVAEAVPTPLPNNREFFWFGMGKREFIRKRSSCPSTKSVPVSVPGTMPPGFACVTGSRNV